MATVSVVVVSYNTKELLRSCLGSLDGAYEVIVVDNASSDGSAEMVEAEFPDVRLIRSPVNLGFGAGNNRGMDAAIGDLVLLLNSDARATPGAIQTLAAAFNDPNVIAAGGRLSNPDGTLQLSTANRLTLWAVFCEQTLMEKVLPNSRFFSPYWTTRRLPQDAISKVKQVMGACLMLRPIQRFDERFFLYCEDTELCRRLERHGDIIYEPRAIFFHELGGSSGQTRWMSVARYNRGKELYFALHHGNIAAAGCFKLDRLGALFRLLIWSLATVLTLGGIARFRRQAVLFARVLIAPWDGPPRP
jgi:GT2 family glycosyltransferase